MTEYLVQTIGSDGRVADYGHHDERWARDAVKQLQGRFDVVVRELDSFLLPKRGADYIWTGAEFLARAAR